MKNPKVALIQGIPAIFDLKAGTDRALEWIDKAAGKGADIILFPESFIPGYPRGMSFGTAVGKRTPKGRSLYRHYHDNSMELPGPEADRIAEKAAEAKAYVILGVTEKDTIHGTLYCTLAYFGPDGRFLGKHRKLKPTGTERVIWGEGDGKGLISIQTPFGVMGGLICWENYMPLARYAMFRKGIQIYLAPTADARESWQASMRHIAMEGRCYVMACNQYTRPEDFPAWLKEDIDEENDMHSRGGSVIVSPMGEMVAGPLLNEEGMVVAGLDMEAIPESRLDFNAAGHYNRPDVFRLDVPDQPETIIPTNRNSNRIT